MDDSGGTKDFDLKGASSSHFEQLDVSSRDAEFDQSSNSWRKKTIWGSNFTLNEDIVLVRGCKDISLDIVAEKYQMSAKYWKHIEERFIHHIGRRMNHTIKSSQTDGYNSRDVQPLIGLFGASEACCS